MSTYRTIVADPPWQYGKFNNGTTGTAGFKGGKPLPLPYPAMTVAEICALPVAALAKQDAHLYLWTTGRYLRSAFDWDVWGNQVESSIELGGAA